ncbi:hypothetical protein RchiOBHm_Chr7g0187581 [Rosa chinensis]|uniref:Uncharacterized protein n=1 Tax=Rosa chinensis TaxID=74649 RepID=A0A2P6P489_ROSCH|nr:hypothetical protein RchiOBHm_Chr7g0187581 [Rosa chinensis]
MKASGTLVASMVAASTMALTSSSSSSSSPSAAPGLASAKGGRNSHTASDKEKFEPRFDGLRFIETLVTAHR